MRKNRKKCFSLLLVIVLLLSVVPLPSNVFAASNKIPFYKGKNYATINYLMPGTSQFLRVDKTVPQDLYVGDYRYATIYDGSIGSSSTRSSLNSGFTVEGSGKYTKSAYRSHPYYHMVPKGLGTARNIIEVGDVSYSEWKSIYGGNASYMSSVMPKYNVMANGRSVGQFYYIGDIAKYSGGYAENTGPEFDGVNTTRLRFLVTGWTDLQSFTTSKSTYNVGDTVSFNFSGWEYVYGKTGVTYDIKITKDGRQVGSFTGSASSSKGSYSSMNSKQDPSHTGRFTKSSAHAFRPSEKGTYTATITVNDAVMRNASKSTTFTVGSVPGGGTGGVGNVGLVVSPKEMTIQKETSFTYTATYYDTNGNATDVTRDAVWVSDGSYYGMPLGYGEFMGRNVGSADISATYKGMTDTAVLHVVDEVIPEPEPEPEPNMPPTVEILGPTEVMVGEKFCLNANASDPDGTIQSYSWSYNGSGTLSGSFSCDLYYTTDGEKSVTVVVTDDDGNMATDVHTITVKPPKPTAAFTVDGAIKENRKMMLRAAHPYNGSAETLAIVPMVEQTWKIEAIDPTNGDKIRTVQDISGNVSYEQVIDWLVKNEGQYKITRYVKNTLGYDDTYSLTIDVLPDEKPVAEFSTVSLIYRDDVAENGEYFSKAKIVISDNSYSKDDTIAKRIYSITFDSDNDGDFQEETPKVISSANEEEVTYITDLVGKYKIEVEVFEEFAQPTIEQFVDLTFDKTTTDRRFHDTNQPNPDQSNAVKSDDTKIVEVDNLAPNVSYDVQKTKTVNIQMDLTESTYAKTDLESVFASVLKPKLNENHINYNVDWFEMQGIEVSDIKLGYDFGLALTPEGEVYSWGNNSVGQLGNGTTLSNPEPMKIEGLTNIQYINTGSGYHSIAYAINTSGQVYLWGDDSLSAESSDILEPKIIQGLPPVKEISSGWSSVIALSTVGEVYAWGGNQEGTNGDGTYGVPNYVPKKITSLSNIVDIDTEAHQAFAVNSSGRVYVWGLNQPIGNDPWTGALGIGSGAVRYTTPQLSSYLTNVKEIHSSSWGGVARTTAGDLYSWGFNSYGNVGDGTSTHRPTPVKIASDVKQADVSWSAGSFIKNNGDFYVWGNISNGQYSYSGSGDVYYPLKVGGLSNIQSYTTTGNGIITTDINGVSYAHGYSNSGNLLNGSLTTQKIAITKVDAFGSATGEYYDADDTSFKVKVTDEALSDVAELTNTIKTMGDYIVGVGQDNTNKTQFESVIAANEEKGKYIPNTSANDFVSSLADYIIQEIATTKSIDLQVALGETAYTKEQIESKINQVLKPMLYEQKISIRNLTYSNVNLKQSTATDKIFTSSTGDRTVATTQVFLKNNTKNLRKIEVNQPIKISALNYFDHSNTVNNKIKAVVLSSELETIAESDYVVPTPLTETAFPLTNSVTLDVNKPYYVGFYVQGDDAFDMETRFEDYQEVKEVTRGTVTFKMHDGTYDIPDSMPDYIADNYYDIPFGITYTPVVETGINISGESPIFATVIENGVMGSNAISELETKVNDSKANLIALGTTTNQSQFESVLSNVEEGTFINNSNLDQAILQMGEYIIDQMDIQTVNLQMDITDSPYTQAEWEAMSPLLNQHLSRAELKANVTFAGQSDMVKKVFAGSLTTFALLENGEVYGMGRNNGALGDGTNIDRTTPVKVILPGKAVLVAPGDRHTAFLLENGDVYTTGENYKYQLGDGTTDGYKLTPVKVSLPGKAISISAGELHTVFLLENGDVYGVGSSENGEIGVTDGQFNTAKKISLPDKAVSISAARYHTTIVLANGDAYNTGSTTSEALQTPIKLSLPSKAISVSTSWSGGGQQVHYFLLENGEVYGDGYDWSYGLGDGTTNTPATMTLPDKAVSIHAGTYHTAAILSNGDAYLKGNNSLGQLADGTTNGAYIPVKANFPSKVASVAVANTHSAFALSNGEMFTVGNNNVGQVGDGTKINRTTPIKVQGLPEGVPFSKTKNLFVTKVSNDVLDATVMSDKIKELDSNIIAIGNSTNQSAFNQVIDNNGGKGTFLDLIEPKSNENLTTLVEQMADYIIAEMNQTKIDLVFGIGNTVHSDTDVFKTKVNEIVIPKLSAAGLSVGNITYGNANLYKDYSSIEIAAQDYQETGSNYVEFSKPEGLKVGDKVLIVTSWGYGGISVASATGFTQLWNTGNTNAFIREVTTDGDVGMTNYRVFDSATGGSGPQYNGKGTLLVLRGVELNGSGPNLQSSQTLATLAKASIYIGAYRDVADAGFTFSDGNPFIKYNNLKGNIYTANSNRGTLTSTYNSSETGYIEFVGSSTQSLINIPTSDNTVFTGILEDNELSIEGKNSLIKEVFKSNSYLVGLGTATNQSEFEQLVAANMEKGTFIENSNLDLSLEQYADYIIQTMKKKDGTNELYITLDETVDYYTYYSDYEKDPKFAERWRYTHAPTVFENDMGLDSRNNQNLANPISQFDKVGKYQPFFAAQDDPLVAFTESSAGFENYRKWSKDADNWLIYVHRKPVPEFNIAINKLNGVFSVTNAAYDLDKQSIDIGFGGGLRTQEFSWRVQGESEWKQGLPTSPIALDKVYEIRNTVVDFQNREESLVKLMSAKNLPPVAEFEPVPNIVRAEEELQMINSSYEPNGDNMTAKWYWKVKGTADSTYAEFSPGGSFINGTPNANWNPYHTFFTEGEYTVKLIVTDTSGLFDSTTRDVTVLANNEPPVADIEVAPVHYIGDTIHVINNSSDPDGDVLTYEYEVTKPTGEVLTISSGDVRIDADGDLFINADQHPTDLGAWDFKLTVSDGDETATDSASTVVLDQIIQGSVAHTDQWLKNLQKYNVEYPSKAFNLDPAVGLVEFLPGEKFVLNSEENTTNRLASVQVYIKESSRSVDYKALYGTVDLTRFDPQNLNGSMWHESMIEQFHDGEVLTFEFIGTFVNGWVDTETVQVRIKDDSYWKQHTRY